MSHSALSKFRMFHEGLLLQAAQAARHFTETSTHEITCYSEKFKNSIPDTGSWTDQKDVLYNAVHSRFLFFGDFHTLKQSQKAFRMLIEAIHQTHQKPVAVAMEIFKATDQDHVNDFLRGTLDEASFLRKIDYKNSWGFPWENYRPILEYCSTHQIQVIAINSHFDAANRLSKRDDFAASILNNWAQKNPETLCLCLIGEYHLADDHLISRIDPSYKILRIIANVDRLALSFKPSSIGSHEFLKLSENLYCLINTVPWIKWNSLTMWEEIHNTHDAHHFDEGDIYTEHHYDFDYQMLHIIKAISELLELSLSSGELSQFDLYIRPDRSTFHYLKSKNKLNRHEFNTADKIIQRDGYYYFSGSHTMITQNFSVNRFAELAGSYLHDILSPDQNRDSFQWRTELQICSSLSALLMNPRRFTLDLNVLQSYYNEVRRRRIIGESRNKREAAKICIPLITDIQNLGSIPKSIKSEGLFEKDRESGHLISKYLGESLALDVFKNLMNMSSEDCFRNLNDIFKMNLSQYAELLRILPGRINQDQAS